MFIAICICLWLTGILATTIWYIRKHMIQFRTHILVMIDIIATQLLIVIFWPLLLYLWITQRSED